MIEKLLHSARRRPAWFVAKVVFFSTALFSATVFGLTYAGLAIAGFVRKRRDYRFPHCPLEAVEIKGDRLKVFNYGHTTFKDMLAAIDSAKHTIFLETYILKSDVIGQRFKRHLIKKAEEGVKVYIAFDGFGSLMMPLGFRRWPKTIHASVFGPLYSYLNFLWLGTYVRNHRKILVVDNEIAYLGGMNIGREYAYTWRDTHCRVEGAKARDVALAFTDLWNRRHVRNKAKQIQLPFEIDNAGEQSIFIRESKPSGSFGQKTIRDTYLDAFQKAQKHIWLTNPYFLPDKGLEQALLEAAKRGVKLDLIVPEKSNHTIVDFLARPLYAKLIEAGATIWLYRHTVIHSKTCTIDGYWSTVGSANLDGRSLINLEINLFILDEGFAARMEEMFQDDLHNCRPARPDEFSKPGHLRVLLETLLQPIKDYI